MLEYTQIDSKLVAYSLLLNFLCLFHIYLIMQAGMSDVFNVCMCARSACVN